MIFFIMSPFLWNWENRMKKKNGPTSELIKDEFYSWQFTNSYSINSYIDLNLHFFFKFNISFMNQSEHRVSVY